MFRSLRARLSAIFIGFLLLVAASVLATFWAIQTQATDATVINLAGRQRMLSQRLLWLSLSADDRQVLDQPVQLFDQSLLALRNGGPTLDAANHPIDLPPPPDAALRAQLDEAAADWALFRAQLAAPQPAELQTMATQLLLHLDAIVTAYETHAQVKLTLLQGIQAIFLSSAMALLAVGYFILRSQLLKPLNELDEAAQRMAHGDLTQPVAAQRDDELGELAVAFEAMRSEVAAAHDELETRVEQRTRELTSAFEFSQEISAQLETDRLLQSVTDRARDLTGALAASLCSIEHDPSQLTLIAQSGSNASWINLRQSLDRDPAQQVVGAGETVTLSADCTRCAFLSAHAPGQCTVAPLRSGTLTLGALCVVRREANAFDANETRALTLLANSAAAALANARLVAQQKQQAEQVAVAAERDRLAAELHDNLAQTLSFLNLKSDRVREMIQTQHDAAAGEELTQMKSAIDSAYGQVRAALTGLREAAPNSDDLRVRLETYVVEASTASPVQVDLKIVDASALALPRVAQTQVYHIVREALINARQHAQAQHVQITVERSNGFAQFSIADDGRGFNPTEIDAKHHLGLSIMRTRAERCGGSLDVKSEAGHGTQIIARLPLVESHMLPLDESSAVKSGGLSSALSTITQE
jgi:two-component system, NarL family, nitrate/nitrite sensor histidine kinase NarX